MKMFLQTLRVLGFILYAIAAVAFGYVLFLTCHRWTVLERPVRLEEGCAFSQTFTVDITETYELGVKCQKTILFRTLKDTLMHDLTATFSVHEGSTLVGDNTDGAKGGASFARDYVFRGIGSFVAKPFHTYRVDVRVTKSLPVLAPTDPLFIIQVEGIHASDAFVAADILFLLAVALALVGTILRVPHLYWSRRQRRTLANQGVKSAV